MELEETRMKPDNEDLYWNEFYSTKPTRDLLVPSQFASFVASECKSVGTVVDIACGNGRDSLFFATFFPTVVGIDESSVAVESCAQLAEMHEIGNAEFACMSITDSSFKGLLSGIVEKAEGKTVLFYARFFLHAITKPEEDEFFSDLGKAMKSGDMLALEYRTTRDASGLKSTPDHFRRFVSPSDVQFELMKNSFELTYSIEGFGMAKYKQDDAYVARSVHVKV
jgi:uncharacterized SAM-dependent methyltransferase